ncbi:MAG: J domain-containing protein, partial [Leptolyngbyaceae cyanobacterium SL_7_1]|nr:J domain-containing protein [Leptolyngbyaceae cyanobacterium SL_7_1]
MTHSHYHTLEVSPHASQAEIKQAYRRLAKIFHPDSNTTITDHERIAGINAAYEVLSDPQQRAHYDRQ